MSRLGIDAFKAEIEKRLGEALPPAREFTFSQNGDRFGWHQGYDGRWHLNLRIESGRITGQALDGLREIAKIHHGDFRLTPNQNLIIAGVDAGQRPVIDDLVVRFGLDGHRRGSAMRHLALACVALPTCTLAMAEAERYLPDFLSQIEVLLAKHALTDAPILLRLSGCPNGCSRPYLGEIALVGKAPGRYNLHLGADFQGRRLNWIVKENIDEAGVLETLEPLLADYAGNRNAGETFGDFLLRQGRLPEPKPIPVQVLS